MSTRCNIHFCEGTPENVVANIYRHCDGYPEGEHGVPAGLTRFFEAVKAQMHDTRFDDPAYLAAKFVVWQAKRNARDNRKPLDFISLGVVQEDAEDGEFVYAVVCRGVAVPTVLWHPALRRGEKDPMGWTSCK